MHSRAGEGLEVDVGFEFSQDEKKVKHLVLFRHLNEPITFSAHLKKGYSRVTLINLVSIYCILTNHPISDNLMKSNAFI